MAIEDLKNRDLLLKLCFMSYLVHILNILGINEEIEEILDSEMKSIDFDKKIRLFDNLLDYCVLTKSGKIIIFEFKKNPLRTKDLKQVYEYYNRLHCKKKVDVIAIIIVISKEGKIKQYNKLDITYHPRIIKTKKINKQKDLKIIRNKFKNNQKLTSQECSLLITLPLFDIKESESEIVIEMCKNIKYKKHCIPEEELDEISIAMYLNIKEYIEEEHQEELMEMIDLTAKLEGAIAQIRNDGKQEGMEKGIEKGIEEGIKKTIQLLNTFTLTEISEFLKTDINEIKKIIQK